MSAPTNTGEVTIGGNAYEVVADVATIDYYLAADSSADTWRALEADDKARYAVGATRVLLRQPWTTPLDLDDPTTTPQAVVDAACELANAAANGTDIVNYAATNVSQKMIKAGSVQVENFRSAKTFAPSIPLPQPAWDMIRPYLAGQSGGNLGSSTGTCGRSLTLEPLRHNDGQP